MPDLRLSGLVVGLIPRPTPGPRTAPPKAFQQTGPMSIPEAKDRSPFPLLEPTVLPPGFAPVDAMLLSGDMDMAILTYGGPTGRLTLVQAPASQYPPGPDGDSHYYVVGESLRPITLGALPAAIATIPARQPGGPVSFNLVWEQGGLLHQLLGHGVDETGLAAVAESVI